MQELNDLFEKTIQDSNIINITRKAGLKFRKVLSEQEVENCINIAVWKALKKYKKDSGLKFTTYVYRGVILECKTQYKKNSYRKPHIQILGKDFASSSDSSQVLDILEELKRQKYGQMVIDKYLNSYTTKEIAVKNNTSVETIRKKIHRTIKNVKLSMI